MEFSINIKINSSMSFVGMLAELNGVYAGWSDGSYDWANQTSDFLANLPPLPSFDEALFKTPLSQRLMHDVTQVLLAIVGGNYEFIRQYLKDIHFVFIVGYPRTGGSYLTKSIFHSMNLDHKQLPEPLAHDSFPNIPDNWHDVEERGKISYFYEAFVQLAEFLVISKAYCQAKLPKTKAGKYLMVKKMHKAIHIGHGLKMLFNPGQVDYLLTFRNPLPIAVSIYEKSGGLPKNGLFPANEPRSAIEVMINYDLLMEGYTLNEISRLDYFQAVEKSWMRFHSKLAISGLFSQNKAGVRIIPYGKEPLESQVRLYQQQFYHPSAVEEVYIHNKADAFPERHRQAQARVASMTKHWLDLGLVFPKLECL